jgi:hypothetical protein
MASDKDRQAARQERLAAALRANLSRRKARARARKAAEAEADSSALAGAQPADAEMPQAPESASPGRDAPLSDHDPSASRRG